MVHEVGSFEAKTRLSELLRLAASGDQIIVLRRGERIAVIVGNDRYEQLTKPAKKDWRESLQQYCDERMKSGRGISTEDFDAIMAESRAQQR